MIKVSLTESCYSAFALMSYTRQFVLYNEITKAESHKIICELMNSRDFDNAVLTFQRHFGDKTQIQIIKMKRVIRK